MCCLYTKRVWFYEISINWLCSNIFYSLLIFSWIIFLLKLATHACSEKLADGFFFVSHWMHDYPTHILWTYRDLLLVLLTLRPSYWGFKGWGHAFQAVLKSCWTLGSLLPSIDFPSKYFKHFWLTAANEFFIKSFFRKEFYPIYQF